MRIPDPEGLIFPISGTILETVRLIARRTLSGFAARHPDASASLAYWQRRIELGDWPSMSALQRDFPKAKALNAERMRFEVQGGDFRLVAAFDFVRKIAFVKFIGSHAEYDRIDALSVSEY
jgi:mRNA interferase HigB